MQNNGTVELFSSLSSIDKASLQEIYTKWTGQYNYCNFATNYKRLQMKIQTKLRLPCIDSNNPNNTRSNPPISAKANSENKKY